MNNINLISLGCSKNLIDSERLIAQLRLNNIRIEFESNDSDFDAVIINTCGFIHDAKEESIEVILEQLEAKKQGRVGAVYVMGCLSERYRSELTIEIPELDGIFGVNDIPEIVKTMQAVFQADKFYNRYLTTSKHFAYMKISEGCDRSCSFCAIPAIRGKHLSVPIEKLVEEAEFLSNSGVKELILIAQDLTYYGYDLYKESKLSTLLQHLVVIPGIEWIRLQYAYPTRFPLEVIELMAKEPKICNYIDIPFQHINDNVLSNMRRNISSTQTYQLIENFRKIVPDIAIRTSLMVGHPGETELAFEELKSFVSQVKFDRLGIFTYSEEEGTYGANQFRDSIPKKVKNSRAAEIMKIQEEIAQEKNLNLIGQQLKIVIDKIEGDFYIGRSQYDTPEVDNEVLITSKKNLTIGEFYQVIVTAAEAFDLIAEIAE